MFRKILYVFGLLWWLIVLYFLISNNIKNELWAHLIFALAWGFLCIRYFTPRFKNIHNYLEYRFGEWIGGVLLSALSFIPLITAFTLFVASIFYFIPLWILDYFR